MKQPEHLSQCYDILYTFGGQLNDLRIRAILANYTAIEKPGDYPVEIKQIVYDGSLKLGAWVYCDPGTGEFEWVYIVGGDEVNRQMIAQAASQGVAA